MVDVLIVDFKVYWDVESVEIYVKDCYFLDD